MSLRRLACTILFAWPSLASAQQGGLMRGTVRDSASGLPVTGAVVIAYGNDRVPVGRNMTDEAGRFRVSTTAEAMSVRVTRMGFRPREVIIPAGGGPLEVQLNHIPTLLEGVQVVAAPSACPRRGDAMQTGGLLDQARAALLSTVVAREANPASVTRLAYERMLDANGEKTESQTVRVEQADRATVSFNASQTAVDFATRGFASPPGEQREFYGPDADVLLDDGFARSYCFRIAARDAAQPNLVGLGFSPATRRGGRVDIEGALWVDTVSRRLSHVQFRYLGLDELSEGFGPGGRVSFREVAPGIVIIDSWSLRVVGGLDAQAAARANAATSRTFVISEIGGELASAEWPSGRIWTAPLGSLRIAAKTRAGTPAQGVSLGLAGTDYAAKTDTAGRAEIPFLIPGTYALTVTDPRLATIGLTIPTDLVFSSARDSVTSHDITLPTAEEFASRVCRASGRVAEESAWLIGRVGASNGAPVPNAKWSVARSGGAGWEQVVNGGTATSNGLFSHCRSLKQGETIQVKAWRDREAPAVSVSTLSSRLTVLPVRLPAAVASRGRGPGVPLRGTVRDSSTGTSVAGAFVELAGTSFSAITDSAGAFTITGVSPGEYTAEVRTDALDSLGAVGRSTFDFAGAATPVQLFVPTGGELTRAMCGPAARPGTGVLLGSVRKGADGPAPPNVRVVAEWPEAGSTPGDTTPRLNWLRARADAEGGFRICGVPLERVLTVRTQLDSGATLAARPSMLRFAADRQFEIVRIALDTGINVGAAFSGVVLSDSTEEAIAGAEVILPDLNRMVATSQNGAFRINDIPPGTHRVTIRRGGFAPITADVAFADNQTVDHRVVLGRPTAAPLAAVQITEEAPSSNPDFENHRKLGVGKFLTRTDLDKAPERRLGDIMGGTSTMGIATQSNGMHAWLIGKRMPVRLAPNKPALPQNFNIGGAVGDSAERANRDRIAASQCGGPTNPCTTTDEDWRDVGFYCPRGGEQMQGIRCACYAQVYVDGRLMNKDGPTEPFDINQFRSDEIEGVEWYASASQTPARYSSLNSPCGVMAIWTRRRG